MKQDVAYLIRPNALDFIYHSLFYVSIMASG